MMEKNERDELQEELEMLEIILDAYNQETELMERAGATDYIDSILDRMNEIKEKLNNTPSE